MRLKLFKEFVENGENLIDSKMSEISDLINSASDGHQVFYEWSNQENNEIIINFIYDQMSIRYEFNVVNMSLTKIVGDVVDFTSEVNSIDEGLDIIEKDIHSILGINESRFQ